MNRRKYHENMMDVVDLTDDKDELIELLSNADGLQKMAQRDLNYRNAEVRLIRDKLKKVRQNTLEVAVTDHAIVRYLERVVGMDISALRADMLSKIPEDFAWSDRVEFVNIDVDGMRYVLRDRLIISVTPIESVG